MSTQPAFSFARREPRGIVRSSDVGEAFLGAKRWLVVAPHDDDAVLGMGLAMRAAVLAGIAVDVAIVSDGGMGYGAVADRPKIIATRAAETAASLTRLGIAKERVHFLGFPDSSLPAHQGARPDGGIARALTGVIRKTRAHAVFAPTAADLHPDHRVVAQEVDIAVFHAAGEIWLELGEPLPAVPARWDYAVYCPFPEQPTLLVRADERAFADKVASVEAYASQKQIASLIEAMRKAGPYETFLRRVWSPYRATDALPLFGGGDIAASACARDVARAAAWARELPDAPWRELVDALKGPQPVLLVGEGSSRLLPGGFAQALARRLGLHGRVASVGGRIAQTLDLSRWRVVALSNSGRTREVLDVVRALPATAKPLALLGLDGGPIAQAVATRRIVLDREEEAVAATVSALGQTLVLAQAVAAVGGEAFPRAALADAVAKLVQADPPDAVRAALPGAKRVFWCGGDDGLCDELALKTMEIAGVVGVAPAAGLVLHGLEEALVEGDLVVLVDPPRADAPQLQKYLIDGTPARVVTLGAEPSVGACWLQADLGAWSSPARLVAGWRLLLHLAAALGRDPDKPSRARKVGNPAP